VLKYIITCFSFTVTIAACDGTGIAWKRILAQNDRSFASPSTQVQSSDIRECAIHCFKTPGSWSLTFHDSSNTCKCYNLDYQNGGPYSSDPGAVFMTRNFTTTSSSMSYDVIDGTYTGPGTRMYIVVYLCILYLTV